MASTNDLVDLIKYRVSRQQDSSIDSRIVAELKAAQDTLESRPTLPWFLHELLTVSLTGAHESFILQSYASNRYLRVNQEFGVRVVDANHEEGKRPLERCADYAELTRYFPGEADEITLPEAYAIMGSTIHVRRRQVVSRSYIVGMYAKDTVSPAAGNTTSWTTYQPDLIMAEAGYNVARWLRDSEAMKLFDLDRRTHYASLVKAEQARADSDQNYVMGDGNGS